MPVNNWIDYSRIPTMKQDYSGSTDFVKNLMNAYEQSQRPNKLQHEMEKLKQEALQGGLRTNIMGSEAKHAEKTYGAQAEQEALKAALLKEFGPREKELALKETLTNIWAKQNPDKAHTSMDVTRLWNDYEEEVRRNGEESPRAKSLAKAIEKENAMTSGRGMSHEQRVWQSLPAANKAEELAILKGWGYPSTEAAAARASGTTMDELRDLAREKGVDVDNAVPIYAMNAPTVNAMHKRGIISAGSEVLDKFQEKAMGPYSSKIFGYSPAQIWDSLKGENEDKLVDFYAARLLEDEGATMLVAKSGGNVNMHAIDNMINKGMGNTKVIPVQMNEKLYSKIRKKARQVTTEMMEAERSHASNTNYLNKNDNRVKSEALENASQQNGNEVITEEDILHTAKELGIPTYMVKERLKSEGRM